MVASPHGLVTRAKDGNALTEQIRFSFCTKLADGCRIETSGGKRGLDVSDARLREDWPGRTVAEVFRRHNERLSEIPSREIVPITNDDELEDFATNSERTEMEFNIARGVYVELSDRELDQYRLAKITEILSRPAKVLSARVEEADS